MAVPVNISISYQSGANSPIRTAVIMSNDSGNYKSPTESVPAAVSGTLTTRTSDTAGVLTSNGHSFTTNDKLCIFWGTSRRYDVTVTGVDTNTITFESGTGDNLPIATTAVSISKNLQVDYSVIGDNLKSICATITQNGIIDFLDSSLASLHTAEVSANNPFIWYDGIGSTNYFAGDTIAKINVYCKSNTAGDFILADSTNDTASGD